jgi:membrane-associated phospholipid phosphatase
VILIGSFIALFFALWAIFIPAGPVVQRGLAWLGHRTAEFRYRDYLPVALLLIGGIVATAWLADEFVDLAELVHAQSPLLQEIDARVHLWARTERSPGATFFFTLMTHTGSPVTLGTIVLLVCLALAAKRRLRWAGYLAFTAVTGALLVTQLKIFFARARPDLAEALRSAHGYSFPSGHAMGTTVVFGALTYLALRIHQPWRRKAAVVAFTLTAIVAVAFSRVYLGVHWISDIAAGLAGGALWVAVTTVAYETFRRIRMIRALRARAKP